MKLLEEQESCFDQISQEFYQIILQLKAQRDEQVKNIQEVIHTEIGICDQKLKKYEILREKY